MSISLRPWWTWTWPALAFAIMIMTMIFGASGATAAAAGGVLIAAVSRPCITPRWWRTGSENRSARRRGHDRLQRHGNGLAMSIDVPPV